MTEKQERKSLKDLADPKAKNDLAARVKDSSDDDKKLSVSAFNSSI